MMRCPVAGLWSDAGRPTVIDITAKDGLLPGLIRALEQGPDGRIWIGAQDGVWTWDGRRIRKEDADGLAAAVAQQFDFAEFIFPTDEAGNFRGANVEANDDFVGVLGDLVVHHG